MARKPTPVSDKERERQTTETFRYPLTTDGPRAASARYNRKTGRVEVELKDGSLFAFPAESTQGLRGVSPDLIAKVTVVGDGYALHWDELDTHYSVPGLLAGRLGTQLWMREHARAAGSVRSAAKARAARRNGKKGGRPRSAAKKE